MQRPLRDLRIVLGIPSYINQKELSPVMCCAAPWNRLLTWSSIKAISCTWEHSWISTWDYSFCPILFFGTCQVAQGFILSCSCLIYKFPLINSNSLPVLSRCRSSLPLFWAFPCLLLREEIFSLGLFPESACMNKGAWADCAREEEGRAIV